MSELLEATRKKARSCRDNGYDNAALEYEAYADCIATLEAQLVEIEALQRYHMMIVQHPYPRDICVTTESDGDWIMYNELTAILDKYSK